MYKYHLELPMSKFGLEVYYCSMRSLMILSNLQKCSCYTAAGLQQPVNGGLYCSFENTSIALRSQRLNLDLKI